MGKDARWPPFEARGPFGAAALQTMGAALPWWTLRLASERRRVAIEGGALHLHVTARAARGPAVLLVHGIGGSSDSAYVVRAARALLAEGFHVARIDLRGAGSSLADAPSLNHAGLSDDVGRAASALASDPLVESVALMGFSLGGNIVLKLAGEWGSSPPAYARAVIAVSPLVDLEVTSKALETYATFPYRAYVLRALLALARQFSRMHPERATFRTDGITLRSTVRDYDRAVIVPMHGFDGVDDYYASQSSGPRLGAIAVPTLFAFAEDDPMIPATSVTPWLARASKAVEVAWSKRGGHVGWFETLSEEGFVKTWPVRCAAEFLRARA
jgi:predicted alpha/beta-fold hydrolase